VLDPHLKPAEGLREGDSARKEEVITLAFEIGMGLLLQYEDNIASFTVWDFISLLGEIHLMTVRRPLWNMYLKCLLHLDLPIRDALPATGRVRVRARKHVG